MLLPFLLYPCLKCQIFILFYTRILSKKNVYNQLPCRVFTVISLIKLNHTIIIESIAFIVLCIPWVSTKVHVPLEWPTTAENAHSGNTKRHPPDTYTAVQELFKRSTSWSPTSYDTLFPSPRIRTHGILAALWNNKGSFSQIASRAVQYLKDFDIVASLKHFVLLLLMSGCNDFSALFH